VHIDLAKQKWQLFGWRPNYWHQRRSVVTSDHWQPEIGPIDAIVPGSAQTALRAARILPDWNIGLNSRLCEWVEHRQWEFRTTLADTPSDQPVILHCDGLDYSGLIAIDTTVIAHFRGALKRHRFDLTPHLSDGMPHTLSILFDEPPPEQGQIGFTSRSQYFKPRYSYSWDWCPRFVPIGIWDQISLHIGQPAAEVVKVLTTLADDLRTGRVNVFLDHVRDGATIGLTLLRGRTEIASTRQALSAGRQVLRLDNLPVEPWFPNRSGAQPLYELIVNHGSKVLHRATVGFKRIRWLRTENAPATARPLLCEINGQSIFLQGVNWTPIRMDYHRVSQTDYRQRIALYKKMGCNVLRVWGGAYLEREIFYDLCDRAGLLVWQEFPLSSSGSESNAPEDASVIAELSDIARDYIRRRGHHACKLLWCGGNELQSPPNEKGEQFPLSESHPALAALKKVVDDEDPETRYLPTSPTGPFFYAQPDEVGKGMHHHVHGPWNHVGVMEQARAYWGSDDAMLRSETGMPGASPLALLKKYAGKEKLWPPSKDNPWWNHASLWWLQYELFKPQLKGLKPASALKRYIELSQQRQAEILKLAARSCKDRFPRCAGILIWMGHDAFPTAANTSLVDFDANPKPAYDVLANIFRSKSKHRFPNKGGNPR
jgi:beta-mannosidase